MTTNRIIQKKKDHEIITWIKENGDSGEIEITDNGRGGFNIDAQFIKLESLYCILKHVKCICEE